MPKEKPDKNPDMRPGGRGGFIRVGSVPGTNKGGTGRPPDELRRAMRESMWSALELLKKKLEDPDTTAGELSRALDTLGKYGLGPIQPEVDNGEKVDVQV